MSAKFRRIRAWNVPLERRRAVELLRLDFSAAREHSISATQSSIDPGIQGRPCHSITGRPYRNKRRSSKGRTSEEREQDVLSNPEHACRKPSSLLLESSPSGQKGHCWGHSRSLPLSVTGHRGMMTDALAANHSDSRHLEFRSRFRARLTMIPPHHSPKPKPPAPPAQRFTAQGPWLMLYNSSFMASCAHRDVETAAQKHGQAPRRWWIILFLRRSHFSKRRHKGAGEHHWSCPNLPSPRTASCCRATKRPVPGLTTDPRWASRSWARERSIGPMTPRIFDGQANTQDDSRPALSLNLLRSPTCGRWYFERRATRHGGDVPGT